MIYVDQRTEESGIRLSLTECIRIEWCLPSAKYIDLQTESLGSEIKGMQIRLEACSTAINVRRGSVDVFLNEWEHALRTSLRSGCTVIISIHFRYSLPGEMQEPISRTSGVLLIAFLTSTHCLSFAMMYSICAFPLGCISV